jgi:hypothetical protein
MSLLCGIKLHQLPVSAVELRLNRDDIIWDNGVIEVNSDYEIGDIIKFPSYNDSNSMPILYLRSDLGFNFLIQTHVNDTKTESEP